MCKISEEQIISCQLTFITIGDLEYEANIEIVLEMIKESGLSYCIGETSTVIKGNNEKMFILLNKISCEMKNINYFMNISISNTCGCKIKM